jgi:hypothetical protein
MQQSIAGLVHALSNRNGEAEPSPKKAGWGIFSRK